MKFKVALSIVESERPFHVYVAIPDGSGKFLLYEYKFKSKTDAAMLAMDYFHHYDKHPEDILRFHRDKVNELEANMKLPFSGF